jgi:Uma2 family endonuclease
MSTLLPIDALATPRRLVLDPPMTDAELFEFCQQNDILRVERTREGVIEMNAPAGGESSSANVEILYQLAAWWKKHRKGCVFDSNAGFHLPDGSMLSPDGAYVTAERLAKVTRQDRQRFLHVCPDFVIELLSKTDRLTTAKKKMERWIENGAQLAWLIDPYKRKALVYRPGSPMLTATGPLLDGEGPVAGFTLNLAEIWEYYEL